MHGNSTAVAAPEHPPRLPTVAIYGTDRCRRMGEHLLHDRFRVVAVDDVQSMLESAAAGDVAVVVLEVTARTPERLAVVPWLAEVLRVIVVSGEPGRAGESARVLALKAGADDVLAEDFGYVELLWRVQAQLRRRHERPGVVRIGALEVDARRHEARLRGEPVQLTPVEFELLRALARDPGATHRREDLLSGIWQWPDASQARTRTLDLHASRLRQKLGRDGDEFVIAVRGVGYRLLP